MLTFTHFSIELVSYTELGHSVGEYSQYTCLKGQASLKSGNKTSIESELGAIFRMQYEGAI